MADVADCCGCCCLCFACAAGCGRLCFFLPCFKNKLSKEEEDDEAYAQAAAIEEHAFYAAQGPTYQQPSPHRGPMLPEPAHMSYPPNPNDRKSFVDPHHQMNGNGHFLRPPQQEPVGQKPTFKTSDNPSTTRSTDPTLS